MVDERLPILGRGETLSEGIPTPSGGGPKRPLRTFDEARGRLLPQFRQLISTVHELDARLRLDSVFFVVALDSEYLAKSYFPKSFELQSLWRFVGSRPWYQETRDDTTLPERRLSRLLYYYAHPQLIERTFERLHGITNLGKLEIEDMGKVDSVYLQGPDDRLIGLYGQYDSKAVELILHPLPVAERRRCIDKVRVLFEGDQSTRILESWMRGSANEPTFLPAIITQRQLTALGEFNPLRAVRPIPGVSFPRVRKEVQAEAGDAPQRSVMRSAEEAEIGVFDGGADLSLSHLAPWVSAEDLTTEPEDPDALEHGTGVCGAVLYGAIAPGQALHAPAMRVRSFRVFPVPQEHGIDLDLYKILDWIESTVGDPNNRHIDVYVLSFGPDMPVDDMEVDLFTVTLDRLAYEYDVLFVVAAGNTGDQLPPGNRIQPPSDAVNGLGVGAFTHTAEGEIVPAAYSCVGPGRPGCSVKPDVAAFGGSPGDWFHILLAGAEGQVTGEAGTSYAAPLVGRLAGQLLYRVQDHDLISPQTAKALIVHNARRLDGWASSHGWGAVDDEPLGVATCAPHEVTVLFNGVIDFTRWVRLWLPFPGSLDHRGTIAFEWTIAYACDVCAATPDDYTLAGKDIIFRPNAEEFRFTKMVDEKRKTKIVDVSATPDLSSDLLADGWSRSSMPLSRTYRKEELLREDGKWDTVARGSDRITTRKRIFKPALDFHAIARADWETAGPGSLSYAAVVTVRAEDTSVPLYAAIRAAVPQLVPVRLRARARRRVKT
jgi:hypothetical protein